MHEKFKMAAQAVKNAKAIVVTAGAGMGVDSGLPDFRGEKGFWKAYPMYERLGVNFVGAANPAHFESDPAFGWGFYGHRANLYRDTTPHEGFNLLLQWIDRFGLDYFVVTSNVDGHFQKAGFAGEKVCEVHGSIQYSQCTGPCSQSIWEDTEFVDVDLDTMRARHIPKCPHCGGVARPNILMFGDYSWISNRTWEQERRLSEFLIKCKKDAPVVVEMGAGTSIPTIRNASERMGTHYRAKVIRINTREPYIHSPHISLACGALEGLRGINALL